MQQSRPMIRLYQLLSCLTRKSRSSGSQYIYIANELTDVPKCCAGAVVGLDGTGEMYWTGRGCERLGRDNLGFKSEAPSRDHLESNGWCLGEKDAACANEI